MRHVAAAVEPDRGRALLAGARGDRDEREARAVASAVAGAPAGEGAAAQPFVAARLGRAGPGRRSPAGAPRVPAGAPPAVGEALRAPSAALDPTTRASMELRFGHEFSGVRLHDDARANRAADELRARAVTVGQHILLGSGRSPLHSPQGARLLAHELAHTIQEAGTGAPQLRCDVVDDVREKLSYGILDWAITDSEALEALALLGSIPAADLPAALGRLGGKFVTRLLDQLPDAARTGEVYQRVLEAAGAAGVAAHAKEQLSYGLFDWAITDAEVTRVFNTLQNLPADQQMPFLLDLHASGHLARLMANATAGHHALHLRPWIDTLPPGRLDDDQRAVLRTIVASGRDVLPTLLRATEVRFAVAIGPTTMPGATPAEWTPKTVRETYLALDPLPDAHVARNLLLQRFGLFDEPAAPDGGLVAGRYNPGLRELALNKQTSEPASTLVHETGHAVDAQMGWSTGPEPAKPSRGGWKVYGADHQTAAQEMVADSDDAISKQLDAAQQGDVVTEMVTAMGNRSAAALPRNVRNLGWFAGLGGPLGRSVLADAALSAVDVGLRTPWFTASDGGEHLGDHVYQEGYPLDWVRYRHEARSRRVSDYQFRYPTEWFAEAYEAYYAPDKRGRGAKLADKDPDTKRYFDTDVHRLAPSR